MKNLKTVTLLAEDGTPATKTNLSSISFVREKAFMGCESLESINFDSVEAIGYSCFEGCSSLLQVDLPESLKIIPSGMFYACTNLLQVKLPKALRYIDEFAFAYCYSIEDIEISRNTVLNQNSFFESHIKCVS